LHFPKKGIILAENITLRRWREHTSAKSHLDRELLKGSIALLILKLLSERDMYGYEIIQESSRRSNEAVEFKEGTPYPALHQLHKRGYLRSEWRVGKNGKQRKYYGLTASDQKVARQSQRDCLLFTKTVNAILSTR
jgi:DNA-binding PadR family transcriptional regulator